MHKKTTTTVTALTLALLMAGNVNASHIANVSMTDGDLYNTNALTGFTTNGELMDGMEVTTCFDSLICETVAFDGTAGLASYGEAVGTGWSLTADGDTFNNPFTFSATGHPSVGGVVSVSLNGRPGNTIFDVIGSSFLSPDSAQGKPFEITGPTDHLDTDINVEYTDKLSVGGTFYNDLYTVMNIDFGDLSFSGSFDFLSDTDNNDFDDGSPITPVDPSPVPEPGTLMLLGAGLLGLNLRRRRIGA